MKFETREEAFTMAVAEKLKYPRLAEWRFEVWQMRQDHCWYYCFKRGHVSIHLCCYSGEEPSYHAMIAKDPDQCGSSHSLWTSTGAAANRSPIDAVRVAYMEFERKAKEVELLIGNVRKDFSEHLPWLTRPKLETNV